MPGQCSTGSTDLTVQKNSVESKGSIYTTKKLRLRACGYTLATNRDMACEVCQFFQQTFIGLIPKLEHGADR
jgi:hypothetical protein